MAEQRCLSGAAVALREIRHWAELCHLPVSELLLQALRLLLCKRRAPLRTIPCLLQASDMRLHSPQGCSGCRGVCLLPV